MKNRLELRLFYGVETTGTQIHHNICFPENETYLSILKRTLLEEIEEIEEIEYF